MGKNAETTQQSQPRYVESFHFVEELLQDCEVAWQGNEMNID